MLASSYITNNRHNESFDATGCCSDAPPSFSNEGAYCRPKKLARCDYQQHPFRLSIEQEKLIGDLRETTKEVTSAAQNERRARRRLE